MASMTNCLSDLNEFSAKRSKDPFLAIALRTNSRCDLNSLLAYMNDSVFCRMAVSTISRSFLNVPANCSALPFCANAAETMSRSPSSHKQYSRAHASLETAAIMISRSLHHLRFPIELNALPHIDAAKRTASRSQSAKNQQIFGSKLRRWASAISSFVNSWGGNTFFRSFLVFEHAPHPAVNMRISIHVSRFLICQAVLPTIFSESRSPLTDMSSWSQNERGAALKPLILSSVSDGIASTDIT
mmetsp:Transcript_7093/g.11446  ORF Transcript_7093/g.11446 Transcript_7093/m.11446 type:complete len:243 (-) Transcript_7093:420-1148(-)